jgi:hypothetical protein
MTTAWISTMSSHAETRPRIDEDGGWCDAGCPYYDEDDAPEFTDAADNDLCASAMQRGSCPVYAKRMAALLRRVEDEDGFHLGDQLKGDIRALLGGE